MSLRPFVAAVHLIAYYSDSVTRPPHVKILG